MSKALKQTPEKDSKIAGQVAEMLCSSGFRQASNDAFNEADNAHEAYGVRRENIERHLGESAAKLMRLKGNDVDTVFWEQQRQIALDEINDTPTGRFADYFFDARLNGRRAEVRPSKGDVSHLPPGERDIVATNSRIVSASRDIEDPLEFLGEVQAIIRDRRAKGGRKFEGPENYATGLKLFTDKVIRHESPLNTDEKTEVRQVVTTMMDGFVRVAERDEPNIVEVTNILSAVRHLPEGTFDARFSKSIIKYTLETLDDFSDDGLKLFIGALSKLDTAECAVPAAMALDLALRKGSKFERSGDMLSVLRAVASLAYSREGERAFGSLLDVRTNLEIASDLRSLDETNKLLYKIVKESTKNPDDSIQARYIAGYVAKKAVEIYKQLPLSEMTPQDQSAYHIATLRAVENYNRI